MDGVRDSTFRRISGEGNMRNNLVSLYYDNTFADKYHLHFDGNYKGANNDKANATTYDNAQQQGINSTRIRTATFGLVKYILTFRLPKESSLWVHKIPIPTQRWIIGCLIRQ